MHIDNNIKLISMVKSKVNEFLLNELKKIGVENIAPSHGDIFYSLFDSKKLTKTELAEKIKRDRSTVTTLVNKLKKLGYLAEKVNSDDRRYIFIYLTEKGKELESEFNRISKKLYQIEYQGISKEEREVFLNVLNKINNNFK